MVLPVHLRSRGGQHLIGLQSNVSSFFCQMAAFEAFRRTHSWKRWWNFSIVGPKPFLCTSSAKQRLPSCGKFCSCWMRLLAGAFYLLFETRWTWSALCVWKFQGLVGAIDGTLWQGSLGKPSHWWSQRNLQAPEYTWVGNYGQVGKVSQKLWRWCTLIYDW